LPYNDSGCLASVPDGYLSIGADNVDLICPHGIRRQ